MVNRALQIHDVLIVLSVCLVAVEPILVLVCMSSCIKSVEISSTAVCLRGILMISDWALPIVEHCVLTLTVTTMLMLISSSKVVWLSKHIAVSDVWIASCIVDIQDSRIHWAQIKWAFVWFISPVVLRLTDLIESCKLHLIVLLINKTHVVHQLVIEKWLPYVVWELITERSTHLVHHCSIWWSFQTTKQIHVIEVRLVEPSPTYCPANITHHIITIGGILDSSLWKDSVLMPKLDVLLFLSFDKFIDLHACSSFRSLNAPINWLIIVITLCFDGALRRLLWSILDFNFFLDSWGCMLRQAWRGIARLPVIAHRIIDLGRHNVDHVCSRRQVTSACCILNISHLVLRRIALLIVVTSRLHSLVLVVLRHAWYVFEFCSQVSDVRLCDWDLFVPFLEWDYPLFDLWVLFVKQISCLYLI